MIWTSKQWQCKCVGHARKDHRHNFRPGFILGGGAENSGFFFYTKTREIPLVFCIVDSRTNSFWSCGSQHEFLGMMSKIERLLCFPVVAICESKCLGSCHAELSGAEPGCASMRSGERASKGHHGVLLVVLAWLPGLPRALSATGFVPQVLGWLWPGSVGSWGE